jgi:NodT family efflux transporter outer membrane factor (OMF) lipoprotein
LRKRNECSALKRWAALLPLLVLWGCAAVGPDYTPPVTEVPPHWQAAMDEGLMPVPADPETLANWWRAFDDPVLTSLIERGVTGNLDLQAAGARVREARARRGFSQAGYYPAIDASGAYTRSRGSDASGAGRTTDFYSVGLDAGWELDVFGGTRRTVEAADADLAASYEDMSHVLVTLLAEVALNYVDVRTLQARIAVAEANAQAQEETWRLARSRYEAGLTDELAVQSAYYNLAGTRAQIPLLRTALEGARNRLAVLTGEAPGAVRPELMDIGGIPVPPPSVAVGVPADAIRQRPDVRRAERQLAAQTARIGVATADLYPRFTLLGAIGYDALALGDLLDSTSLAWRLGPRISWRLFDGGAIRRNIEIRSALQEQALTQYQATILASLEEAENAMTAYVGEQLRRERLIEATEAAQAAFQLARDQYEAGLMDFTTVLIAQRSLLSFQDQLAQSEGAVTINLVRLYKAMGGGWSVVAEEIDLHYRSQR